MNGSAMAVLIGILFAGSAGALAERAPRESARTFLEARSREAQESGVAASAENGRSDASLPTGIPIHAVLGDSIDSKKAKPGDIVTARTTEAVKLGGKTLLPNNTKLLGHVTEASARAKGASDSSLGIVFDKAVLKSGQEVPLTVAVQALASPQSAASANFVDEIQSRGASVPPSGAPNRAPGNVSPGTMNPSGPSRSPATETPNQNSNSTASGTAAETGAVGAGNAAGQLTADSRGVFGLDGMGMSSTTAGTAGARVITSSGKTVHLDSGTRLLLVTHAPTRAATPNP